MAPFVMLARIIRVVGGLIAAFLVAGILLVVFDASEDNGLVDAVLEVGRFFADPFRGIFELDDNHLQIAINWGIAAAVYVVVAGLIAFLLARTAARGAARDR